MNANFDRKTVRDFGKEWSRFDQSEVDDKELQAIFHHYFEAFPWNILPEQAVGFDLGCGSGRWARFVAPSVSTLYCIDASAEALEVAQNNLTDYENCRFVQATVGNLPIPDNSMDFGYSLGVLHHVPNTQEAIKACVSKLKPGAPLLLYLYYAFENRPLWFRMIWRSSDMFRRLICQLPFTPKRMIADLIAVTIYFPLARLAGTLERMGMHVEVLPLSAYRKRSFYSMRTDALDRFGTRLEQRFTLSQTQKMMEDAGLEELQNGNSIFWCVAGIKRKAPNSGD